MFSSFSPIRMHTLIVFFTMSLFSGDLWADTLSAIVTKVSDGDTLIIRLNGYQTKVRLFGIDTPEMDQPYGEDAKRLATLLALHKNVSVEVVDVDRYGRLVAHIRIDTKSLNEELLRAGMAWHYKHYSSSKTFDAIEREARSDKRGLWKQKHPVPPWEWRKNKRIQPFPRTFQRKHHNQSVHPSPLRLRKKFKYAPYIWRYRSTREQENPFNPPTQNNGLIFRGNTRSKVYHAPRCRSYRCKNCTMQFESQQIAKKMGYRPHWQCIQHLIQQPKQP